MNRNRNPNPNPNPLNWWIKNLHPSFLFGGLMGVVVFILVLTSYVARTSGEKFPLSNWLLGLTGGTVVALTSSACWSALQQRERDEEMERLQQDVQYLASRQSQLEQVTGSQVEQFGRLQQYVMSLGASSSENRDSAVGLSGVPDSRLAGGGQADSAASRLPQSPGSSYTANQPLQSDNNQQPPSQSIPQSTIRPVQSAQQQQVSQPVQSTQSAHSSQQSVLRTGMPTQSAAHPVQSAQQQQVSQPTHSTQSAQSAVDPNRQSVQQPVQQSSQPTSSQSVRTHSPVQSSSSTVQQNGYASNSTGVRPNVPQGVSKPVHSTKPASLSEEDLIIQELVASQASELPDEWDAPVSN